MVPTGRRVSWHCAGMRFPKGLNMAKGQQKSNREAKKPKANKKPAAAASSTALPERSEPAKSGKK